MIHNQRKQINSIPLPLLTFIHPHQNLTGSLALNGNTTNMFTSVTLSIQLAQQWGTYSLST